MSLLAPALALPLAVLLLTVPATAGGLTDPTGRRVMVDAPPRRIVSLVPSVTELLFAIGAQDRLVGVTDFCDYPPAARRKPRVGGMLAPSLESLVALRPDLVVATAAGNREETFTQLERLGIAVYVVNPASVADALDLIARLGAITGRQEAARRLAASLRARIDRVALRVRSLPRPRALYVVWPDPLIVPGRGALLTELLALAGADSVTADAGEPYPRFSLEAAIARAPQVIFVASHGPEQGRMAREKWERFTSLPAVKAGRLYAADGNLLHRYGPRMVDGLEQLARDLHPEAFAGAAGPGTRPTP
jgi:iron complex transport system substrate-binding protein